MLKACVGTARVFDPVPARMTNNRIMVRPA
jgi:hypothetical protein